MSDQRRVRSSTPRVSSTPSSRPEAAAGPTSRDLITSVLGKYEGVRIVYSPEEAEFFIECAVKSSTESKGRQRSHYLRQQMTAFTLDESGRKRILWYENETYEESGGISFSRPNEVNLAMHFVSMMKKLRSGQNYKGQGRSAAP